MPIISSDPSPADLLVLAKQSCGTPGSQDASDAALMSQFGITCLAVSTYHFGEWRYSNLGDAVAQARKIAASPATLK